MIDPVTPFDEADETKTEPLPVPAVLIEPQGPPWWLAVIVAVCALIAVVAVVRMLMNY